MLRLCASAAVAHNNVSCKKVVFGTTAATCCASWCHTVSLRCTEMHCALFTLHTLRVLRRPHAFENCLELLFLSVSAAAPCMSSGSVCVRLRHS
jgi:hypothetical protein